MRLDGCEAVGASGGGRVREGQTEGGRLLAGKNQTTTLGFGQPSSQVQTDSVAGRRRVSTGEERLRLGEEDAVVLDRHLESVTELLNDDPDRASPVIERVADQDVEDLTRDGDADVCRN